MNPGCRGTANDLEYIRRFKGNSACIYMFSKLAKDRRQNAVLLVNDSRLSFTSLYILQHEIEELNLRGELSKRNQLALNICEKILDEKNFSGDSDCSVSLSSEEVHRVLLWVFNTGAFDDGLDNEFDQVLDAVASVLIKIHHEKQILPLMTDMIFKRNRHGRYIHDLVWACFCTRDRNALRFIAEYLRSFASKDVELARTLLHLPQDVPKTGSDRQKQYITYLSWLKENNPYIYFTGESFQYTNDPVPCVVDWESKYLCKDGSVYAVKQLASLTDTEYSSLTDFNTLPENEKEILARHSQKLYGENKSYWNQWMQYPIGKQIQIVRYGGGNPYDSYR